MKKEMKNNLSDPGDQLFCQISVKEQLLIISAFFGFSRTRLKKIMEVTRQSVHLWYADTEPDTEHYEKIQKLVEIVLEIDPHPPFPLFHVYLGRLVSGYDRSLIEYLSGKNFVKDKIFRLTKVIYDMTRERRKRIESLPKTKHGNNPFILNDNLDSFENENPRLLVGVVAGENK